jgi:hypothetical protein
MSQPPEEFDEIRRLLTLKRYEAPPPGYFDRFAGQVMARIEAEQRTAAEPWWNPLLASLGWQRFLAAANLAALAGVAIIGVTLVNLRDDEAIDPDRFAALQTRDADSDLGVVQPAAVPGTVSGTVNGLFAAPRLQNGHSLAEPVVFQPASEPAPEVDPEKMFATPQRSDRQMRFYLRDR